MSPNLRLHWPFHQQTMVNSVCTSSINIQMNGQDDTSSLPTAMHTFLLFATIMVGMVITVWELLDAIHLFGIFVLPYFHFSSWFHVLLSYFSIFHFDIIGIIIKL